MRNVKMLLLALVVLSMASACKKGGTAGKTANGYDYTMHKKGSGSVAKEGDFVVANMYVRKDTQLLYSSAMKGTPERFVIEDVKGIKDPIAKMILEAVRMLGKGDSATFVMKMDSSKVVKGFEGAKEARVTLAIQNIMNESEFVATLAPPEKEMFLTMKPMRLRAKVIADSATALAKDYTAGKFPANVQTTASGLKYAILREGTGNFPKKGQGVAVHYYGALKDGTPFDQSFERGQPITFPIGQGQVIPGWDEGIALLKEGTTAVFFIPTNLAYGEKVDPSGPIPPNADLLFYVDLLKAFDAPKQPAQPQMPEMPKGK